MGGHPSPSGESPEVAAHPLMDATPSWDDVHREVVGTIDRVNRGVAGTPCDTLCH